jgi:predicted nucleic acid-binding protein
MASNVPVILPDTSAWVEFLRATGSPVHLYLRSLIAAQAPLATNEVIVMELLAGAGDDAQVTKLQRLLHDCDLLPLRGLADYEEAARLYCECRRQGVTIRRMIDCLVAVTALAADLPVLHMDRDFDVLARHSALKIAVPPPDEPESSDTGSGDETDQDDQRT